MKLIFGDFPDECSGFLVAKLNHVRSLSLVEESDEDTDYYLNRTTFEMLKEKGLDSSVAALLETAFEGKDELEIEWTRG